MTRWAKALKFGLPAAVVAALLVGTAAYLGWIPGLQRGPAFQGNLGPAIVHSSPKPAPAIALTGADGAALSLDKFRDRVVVLNFWATWCAPCVEEMPSLDRLQVALGGSGLEVVALAVDREGKEAVAPFLAKLGVERLAMYLDPPGASMRAFAVRGLPTTVVIDREGREVARVEGAAPWDKPEAAAFLRRWLGPQAR